MLRENMPDLRLMKSVVAFLVDDVERTLESENEH